MKTTVCNTYFYAYYLFVSCDELWCAVCAVCCCLCCVLAHWAGRRRPRLRLRVNSSHLHSHSHEQRPRNTHEDAPACIQTLSSPLPRSAVSFSVISIACLPFSSGVFSFVFFFCLCTELRRTKEEKSEQQRSRRKGGACWLCQHDGRVRYESS